MTKNRNIVNIRRIMKQFPRKSFKFLRNMKKLQQSQEKWEKSYDSKKSVKIFTKMKQIPKNM